jgi:lysophospholipase L1-like esterase
MSDPAAMMVPSLAIVGDGQSHTNIPLGAAIPVVVAAQLGARHIYVGIGGTAWSTLARTASTRSWPALKAATQTVAVLIGGTQDVLDDDTGAVIYDDIVAYANAMRAAGPDNLLIVACTIPPVDAANPFTFGAWTDARESVRQMHNLILQHDPLGAFDAVVDITVPPYNDPHDTYPDDIDPYVATDGVHFKIRGAAEIARRLVAPVVEDLLADTYTPPTPDALPTLTGGSAVDAEDDDGNWWRTLTFTSSSTLTLVDADATGVGVEAEWLVVDGGAAGGGPGGTVNRFGGGGAGGRVQSSSGFITASQTVTVGTGGTADSTPTTSPAQGGDGTASSLGALTVGGVSGGGGDGGATASFNNGRTGVNGGGGGAVTVAGTGGATTGGGNAGGNGFPSATANLRAGGGGGSTAATGGNAASADGGDGGAGTEWPTSSGTFYGGGGGGSAGSGAAGSGGTGGGGAGALGTAASGTAGTANTGGGGGGCAGTGTPGAGGTGVVKVRFRIYP